jgi:hypothetical protein
MIPEDPDACSYSGDPGTSARDAVRFWCQDTEPGFWLLTDFEHDYLIEKVSADTNDDVVWIASVAATVIAAKFTREVTVSADGVSVDVGALQQKYRDLAMTLRDTYEETHGDMELPSNALWPNKDWSIPDLLFGIGMSDNFYAGEQDYGSRRLPASSPSAGDPALEYG